MILSITQWYAISFAGLGLVIGIARFRFLVVLLLARLQCLCLLLTYGLMIDRKYWSSITWLQGMLFSLYLAANIVTVLLFAKSYQDVSRRCGILAAINMTPMFMSGRSIPIFHYLGLPLHVHHLLHHWIGRICIVQALTHVILAVAQRADGGGIYSLWPNRK